MAAIITFDAWNRLAKVKRAYRDASGNLTTSTVATMALRWGCLLFVR